MDRRAFEEKAKLVARLQEHYNEEALFKSGAHMDQDVYAELDIMQIDLMELLMELFDRTEGK